jgi:hypothetical protein
MGSGERNDRLPSQIAPFAIAICNSSFTSIAFFWIAPD